MKTLLLDTFKASILQTAGCDEEFGVSIVETCPGLGSGLGPSPGSGLGPIPHVYDAALDREDLTTLL